MFNSTKYITWLFRIIMIIINNSCCGVKYILIYLIHIYLIQFQFLYLYAYFGPNIFFFWNTFVKHFPLFNCNSADSPHSEGTWYTILQAVPGHLALYYIYTWHSGKLRGVRWLSLSHQRLTPSLNIILITKGWFLNNMARQWRQVRMWNRCKRFEWLKWHFTPCRGLVFVE